MCQHPTDCGGVLGSEAGGGARGSSGLGEAGDLRHQSRFTHLGAGDEEGLKGTSGGGAEELPVRGGGRGRLGGITGDTGLDGTSRETDSSGLDGTSGETDSSGLDGTSGETGSSGLDGTSGETDSSGLDGTSGDRRNYLLKHIQ
ncbi:sericin-1-like [Megalobrama amblycephala]|uniref:sericin-1-like n=1 Tax=Megalobrama amblycephala TaxID=75352 RepID=UPI002014390E|nr:sericin-1-like [Megalobrama amblycephala]